MVERLADRVDRVDRVDGTVQYNQIERVLSHGRIGRMLSVHHTTHRRLKDVHLAYLHCT